MADRVLGLLRHESGAASAEYGLIVAGISLALMTSLHSLGGKFGMAFDWIIAAIN